MNLYELLDEANPRQLNLEKLFSQRATVNINTLAANVRDLLGITLDDQKNWNGTEDALKKWREALELNGIFLFKDAFKDYDFSGFCLYDELFPIIILNNSMTKSRQIFTIFHELAHLIFETSGIDKILEDYLEHIPKSSQKIEVACNAFASEFLVPTKDFRVLIKGYSASDFQEKLISEFAETYRVSRDVILRKLLILKKIDQDVYDKFARKWAGEYRNKVQKPGGGNFCNTKATYLGKNYIELVFKKLYQNSITNEEAADFLSLKSNQISGLEAVILK